MMKNAKKMIVMVSFSKEIDTGVRNNTHQKRHHNHHYNNTSSMSCGGILQLGCPGKTLNRMDVQRDEADYKETCIIIVIRLMRDCVTAFYRPYGSKSYVNDADNNDISVDSDTSDVGAVNSNTIVVSILSEVRTTNTCTNKKDYKVEMDYESDSGNGNATDRNIHFIATNKDDFIENLFEMDYESNGSEYGDICWVTYFIDSCGLIASIYFRLIHYKKPYKLSEKEYAMWKTRREMIAKLKTLQDKIDFKLKHSVVVTIKEDVLKNLPDIYLSKKENIASVAESQHNFVQKLKAQNETKIKAVVQRQKCIASVAASQHNFVQKLKAQNETKMKAVVQRQKCIVKARILGIHYKTIRVTAVQKKTSILMNISTSMSFKSSKRAKELTSQRDSLENEMTLNYEDKLRSAEKRRARIHNLDNSEEYDSSGNVSVRHDRRRSSPRDDEDQYCLNDQNHGRRSHGVYLEMDVNEFSLNRDTLQTNTHKHLQDHPSNSLREEQDDSHSTYKKCIMCDVSMSHLSDLVASRLSGFDTGITSTCLCATELHMQKMLWEATLEQLTAEQQIRLKSPNKTSLDRLSAASLSLRVNNTCDADILVHGIIELANRREHIFPYEQDEAKQISNRQEIIHLGRGLHHTIVVEKERNRWGNLSFVYHGELFISDNCVGCAGEDKGDDDISKFHTKWAQAEVETSGLKYEHRHEYNEWFKIVISDYFDDAVIAHVAHINVTSSPQCKQHDVERARKGLEGKGSPGRKILLFGLPYLPLGVVMLDQDNSNMANRGNSISMIITTMVATPVYLDTLWYSMCITVVACNTVGNSGVGPKCQCFLKDVDMTGVLFVNEAFEFINAIVLLNEPCAALKLNENESNVAFLKINGVDRVWKMYGMNVSWYLLNTEILCASKLNKQEARELESVFTLEVETNNDSPILSMDHNDASTPSPNTISEAVNETYKFNITGKTHYQSDEKVVERIHLWNNTIHRVIYSDEVEVRESVVNICELLIVVCDWYQVLQIQYDSDNNYVKNTLYALAMAYEQYDVFDMTMVFSVTNSVPVKGKEDYRDLDFKGNTGEKFDKTTIKHLVYYHFTIYTTHRSNIECSNGEYRSYMVVLLSKGLSDILICESESGCCNDGGSTHTRYSVDSVTPMYGITYYVLIVSDDGLRVALLSEGFSVGTVVPEPVPVERSVSTTHGVHEHDNGSATDNILKSLVNGPRLASSTINKWQSSIERKKYNNNKAGPSYKKELGHSTAGQSSLQRKMCHSNAGQDLTTKGVVLTVSTAGKSSYEKEICHSTAGKSSSHRKISQLY